MNKKTIALTALIVSIPFCGVIYYLWNTYNSLTLENEKVITALQKSVAEKEKLIAQKDEEIKQLKRPSAQLDKNASEEARSLYDALSKHMEVPNETPTIARVDDKEKLKDQPFFKNAENGDRLVIFPESKKAIIYRESSDSIINSGPIAITGQ